jgi:hypothetical protein
MDDEAAPDAAPVPQALAVVGEVEPAPLEIPIADFGGFAIDPPIVVGAEPWAAVRPTMPTAPTERPADADALVTPEGIPVLPSPPIPEVPDEAATPSATEPPTSAGESEGPAQ